MVKNRLSIWKSTQKEKGKKSAGTLSYQWMSDEWQYDCEAYIKKQDG